MTWAKQIFKLPKAKTIRRICVFGLWFVGRLIRFMPVSLEVCFRHTFGERYTWDLAVGLALCFTYGSLARCLSPGNTTVLLPAFLWMFLALALYHQVSAWLRRSARATAVHSYSSGLSWRIWEAARIPAPIIQRYVEPVAAYCLGRAITKTDPALGFWFRASAVLLLVKGHLRWFSVRARLLNTIDSHLEAAELHGNVAGRLGSRPGLAEAPPVVQSLAVRESGRPEQTAKPFDNLDRALKKLLEPRQAAPAKSGASPAAPPARAPTEEPIVESPS